MQRWIWFDLVLVVVAVVLIVALIRVVEPPAERLAMPRVEQMR